jgi:hypothetical protein
MAKARIRIGRWSGALVAAVASAVVSMAQAHHSFAMFDDKKETRISGIVTEFRFTNPHTYFRIDVVAKPGDKPKSYLLEGPTPVILRRLGWTAKTLIPGRKVTVLMQPLKDGKPGGHSLNVWLEDGKLMSMVAEDVKYR